LTAEKNSNGINSSFPVSETAEEGRTFLHFCNKNKMFKTESALLPFALSEAENMIFRAEKKYADKFLQTCHFCIEFLWCFCY
jgi:hypothetical protein